MRRAPLNPPPFLSKFQESVPEGDKNKTTAGYIKLIQNDFVRQKNKLIPKLLRRPGCNWPGNSFKIDTGR